MFSRKFAFAGVLFLIACSPGIVCAQGEGPTARPRPAPKPSPTPTKPIDSPVTSSSGGAQATSGLGILAATATPTPKPSPTPTAPGPVGPTPGGPQAQFNGVWILDKTRSQGLSPRMQGADKVAWIIMQDDRTISIDQRIEGGQPPAGGGGGGAGGGGGMGGGRPPAPPAYKLDGSEATSDMTSGPTTGKLTLKATWFSDVLELSRKTVFTTDQGDRVTTTTQKLSLSGDGKILTVNIHSEGGRGASTDSTLVFNKQ